MLFLSLSFSLPSPLSKNKFKNPFKNVHFSVQGKAQTGAPLLLLCAKARNLFEDELVIMHLNLIVSYPSLNSLAIQIPFLVLKAKSLLIVASMLVNSGILECHSAFPSKR